MSPVPAELVASIREELDLAYIRALGRGIGEHLLGVGGTGDTEVRPVVVAYTPGNGTSYGLALTPLRGAIHVTAERSSGFAGSRPFAGCGPTPPREAWVVVAVENHGAYTFPVLDPAAVLGLDPGYVAGKLDLTIADGVALVELFRNIAPDRRGG